MEIPWLPDAYEAEALLGVCANLVRNISSRSFFSLPNWKLYFYTFLLYLSHPASTVRQGSSSIFKDLISKNQHPIILKLLLQSLASNWTFEDLPPTSKIADLLNSTSTLPSILAFIHNGGKISSTWEWKEGRLFSFELILKFVLTNHTHYIFPFAARRNENFGGSLSPTSNSIPLRLSPLHSPTQVRNWT